MGPPVSLADHWQEYLSSARKGGQLGRTAGLPYNFEFYLHEDTSDLSESVDQLPAPGKILVLLLLV